MRFLLALLCFISVDSSAQSFYARTTGQLPYLNYGLGEDRLGGAKMGHVDSNVLLKVIDSAKEEYKVQLSRQHVAYLPKTSVRRDDSVKLPAMYLTGSWRVWGDSLYDYVSIGLTEKLPYRSQQQVDPARIVIDIFGAVSNTNWLTQLPSAKEIKRVWHEQLEDDVFRVYIELQHQNHWGYAIKSLRNSLQIKVKRQPKSLKLKRLKIAVDAGHGGSNSGANGLTTSIMEKEYTLKIAKQLQSALQKKGADVYMTRVHDTDLTMVGRTLMVREQQPDLLISIHLNSSSNKTVKGTSTYYRYVGFRPLSQAILSRMLELGLNNFGNIGSFNFALSGPTEYPNCLVEVAFLSNEEDEKRIIDPDFQKDVAKKIVKGIEDWLKAIRKADD